MKKLFGYLVAAVFFGITYVLVQYGMQFSELIDMVYPYIIRTAEISLAEWSSQVSFLIWQMLAVALLAVILATLIPVIVLKKSVFTWFGWVLACASFLFMLHTAAYGMNYYAGALADDLRMENNGCTMTELVNAAEYYRNQANSQADRVPRDAYGSVVFDDFEVLADRAGSGFRFLAKERFYPVFAGSTLPVKRLGWEGTFTAMGITGFTFPLTGEAAVNASTPDVALPFTMCREMARRMCIANERDANFAAFLACSFNPNSQFQYSAYFMAYYTCYQALISIPDPQAADAAARISQGVNDNLRRDMQEYEAFFKMNRKKDAADFADGVNNIYRRLSGEAVAPASYSQITELLVAWHIQEIVIPATEIVESKFDPYDESQVDLSGIVNARG